jgi:hypothetical protein
MNPKHIQLFNPDAAQDTSDEEASSQDEDKSSKSDMDDNNDDNDEEFLSKSEGDDVDDDNYYINDYRQRYIKFTTSAPTLDNCKAAEARLHQEGLL